jgi:histo-blood group ABO system transferase
MKICILTIATNRYLRFIEPLYHSLEKYFLPGHELHFLLFTNHKAPDLGNIRVHRIDHEDWPMPTLKRYHYFLREADYLAEHDYCFYLDADMRMCAPVNEEVLGQLVGVQHPAFYSRHPADFSYERNPSSRAYVPLGDGERYYAGGFHGGCASSFLDLSRVLSSEIQNDLDRGIIATWHDESHLNRYFIDHPPETILSPSYCAPEEWLGKNSFPFEPKIIALQKDHDRVRYGAFTPKYLWMKLNKLFKRVSRRMS